MSSEMASFKKLSGHETERYFAEIIGGEVNLGSQQAKKDVIDKSHRSHSVKGGKWWQIFLYRKSHWENNTVFKGLGNISKIMIECLDVFPNQRSDYIKNKNKYKKCLATPMKNLLNELSKPHIFPAFLSKAIFNDGEVDYLTIKREKQDFHIFEKNDVLKILSKELILKNSMARNSTQHDCQKVLFKIKQDNDKIKNIGEIEVRNDSDTHYLEMKCRFDGGLIFALFSKSIKPQKEKRPHLIAYGRAVKQFTV